MGNASDQLTYITEAAEGTLPNSRRITAGSGLVVNDSGPGSTLQIASTGQLLAFENLAATGLVTRTAANTIVARTLVSAGGSIAVTNGAGVAGNPSLDVVDDTSVQQVNISVSGVDQGQSRARLNLIAGEGAGVAVASNGGTNSWDITFSATGAGGALDQYFWVSRDSGGALAHQVNMGALTTGLVGVTVAAGNATPSIFTNIVDDEPNRNMFIGLTAGNGTLTGVGNIATGANSLKSVTTGSGNFAYGDSTLEALTTGAQNIAIGSSALAAVTIGSNNCAIGFVAGTALISGGSNTYLGAYAGELNVSSNYNTAIGANSLSQGTGTQNTAIGANSCTLLTTGVGNTVVGFAALANSLTASNTTAIGTQALGSLTTATNCTAVGYIAGGALTTANQCTLIGYGAGAQITTGVNNTIVGNNAGRGLIVATDNTLIGNIAGNLLTTDSECIAIGSQALSANIGIGNGIIAIGYNAAGNAACGTQCTLVGWRSGQTGAGNNNTTLGYNALAAATAPATDNTLIGTHAGSAMTTATSNVGVGSFALALATTGRDTVAIGYNAVGSAIFSGNQTVCIGSNAGGNMTTSTDSIVIGFNAGFALTSAPGCIAIGTSALAALSGPVGMTIGIGHQALEASTSSANVAVGYQAAWKNTTGPANTAIGIYALAQNTTGAFNTAVGANALTIPLTQSHNTAIGNSAGTLAGMVDFSQCTFIGDSSLPTVSTIVNSTAVGYNSQVASSNTVVLGAVGTATVIGDREYNTTPYALSLRILGSSASMYMEQSPSQTAPVGGGVLAVNSNNALYYTAPAASAYLNGDVPTMKLLAAGVGTMGTAQFATANSITIATTSVKTASIIMVSLATGGLTETISCASVDIVDSTSFIIRTSNAASTAFVNWWILNPV